MDSYVLYCDHCHRFVSADEEGSCCPGCGRIPQQLTPREVSEKLGLTAELAATLTFANAAEE